jgi:hypothetical protein
VSTKDEVVRFRKRPIIVEAVRFNPNATVVRDPDFRCPPGVRPTSYLAVARLLGTSGCSHGPEVWNWSVLGVVETLGGPAVIKPGDWIITGVKGERYPCEAAIFAATYEPEGRLR